MHLVGHCWVLLASVKTNTHQFRSQKQPLTLLASDSCYFPLLSWRYYCSHSPDTHSSAVDGYFSCLLLDERIIKLQCSSQYKSYSVNQQWDILKNMACNDHRKFCFPNTKTEIALWKSPEGRMTQSHATCATFPDSNPRILFFFWLCLRTMIHLQQNYYCNVSKFISFQKLHLITGCFFKGVGRECHEVIFHYRAVVWLLWKKKWHIFSYSFTKWIFKS